MQKQSYSMEKLGNVVWKLSFRNLIQYEPRSIEVTVSDGKRTLTTELALKIEKALGIPAKILLAAQTQYEIDSANADKNVDAKHETVAVTIPIHDRNLLQELVKKFGWTCVF